jgi:hypothetical protein
MIRKMLLFVLVAGMAAATVLTLQSRAEIARYRDLRRM